MTVSNRGRRSTIVLWGAVQLSAAIFTLWAHLVPGTLASLLAMGIWLTSGPFFAGDICRWVGRVVYQGSVRGSQDPLDSSPLLVKYVISWLVGILALFVVASATWLFFEFTVTTVVAFQLVAFAVFAIRSLSSLRSRSSTLRGVELPRVSWFLPALVIGAVGGVMIVVRGFSPPPFQFGWDIFTHSYLTNQMILESTFSPLPSTLSNSILVDAYTTSFHVLSAVVVSLGHGDVLLLFWIGPALNLAIFSFGVALLSRAMGLEKTAAFIAIILGATFHEWTKVSMPYFAPGALIAALTPAFIAFQFIDPKLNRLPSVHVASLSLLLVHFLIGAALLLTVYVIPIGRMMLPRGRASYRALGLAVLLAVTGVLLIPLVAWDAFNSLFSGLIDSLVANGILFSRVSIGWKIEILTWAYYTIPLVGGAIAGVAAVHTRVLISRGQRPLSPRRAYLALLMLAALLLFLVQLEQSSRFLFLARPGLFIFAAVLCLQLGGLGRLRSHVGSESSAKGRLVAYAIAGVILASGAYPTLAFINKQRFEGDTEGIATSFIHYELEMGHWIRYNLPADALLVSDPRTQDLMQPFGMRKTLFGEVMSMEDQAILKSAFHANSTSGAHILISDLLERHGLGTADSYLIVSGRTLVWAQSTAAHVFRPKSISNYTLLEIFEHPHFTLVKSISQEIFLYKIA